jgi:hypothetical protein
MESLNIREQIVDDIFMDMGLMSKSIIMTTTTTVVTEYWK